MNNQYETKKFYNNIAQKSFDEWFDNPLLLPTLSGFINKLPEKPSVLDLGCGTGGESKRLVQLVPLPCNFKLIKMYTGQTVRISDST